MKNIMIILLCISNYIVFAQNTEQTGNNKGVPNLKLYKSSNGYYGFTDSITGKFIIFPKYTYAEEFKDGLAGVGVNATDSKYSCASKLYGYIDYSGQEVIPCKYSFSWGFSEGLVGLKLDSTTWVFLDRAGKEVLKTTKYDHVRNFDEGISQVRVKNGGYGFIDRTGKEIIPCIYDSGYTYSNGIIEVKKNYKSLYLDRKGQKVVPKKQ